MQSFLTIMIAGTAVFAAMLMMPDEADRSAETYVEHVKQVEPVEQFAMSVIVLEPEQPLVLALDIGQAFDPGHYVYAEAISALTE